MYKTTSFKKKLLTTAIASAAATVSYSGSVFAQDATVEEVLVTGIRSSLERSMDVKRNSAGVVDAISAEDIGKMPDANLAESLQRIAGVSITRTNGEGARVTVRGIDPAMNMVTLNGRNMPAVTNDGNTGDRSSRAFDFATLASESVSGVEVYKTGRANISGGGLGASINLKTVRPLDVGGTKASFAAKAVNDSTVSRNDTGRDFTPELSGIYSWANEEGTFGVAVTAAYQERENVRSNAFVNNWQLRTVASDGTHGGTPGAAVITNPLSAGSLYAIPTDLRYALEDNHRERTNAMLTLQFRPVEELTTTLDYLYTNYDLQAERAQQSTWYNESAITAMTFDSGQEVATPIIYQETYSVDAGKDVSFAQQKYEGQSDMESFGLNQTWQATDALKLSLDYHNSKATNYTTQTELGLNANIVTGEYSDWSHDLPIMGVTIDDSRADKGNNNGIIDGSDISAAMGSAAWDKQKTSIEQLKLDGTLDLGEFAFFKESTLGFGYDDRSDMNTALVNNGTSPRITMGNWGGVDPDTFGPDWPTYFSSRNFAKGFPSFNESTKNSHFLKGGLDGNIGKIIENLEWVYASGVDPDNFKDFPNGKVQPNGVISLDRSIEEDVTAFYVSFEGAFDIAGMESHLNLGVRHEKTDTISSAVVNVPVNQSWDGDNDWSLVYSSNQAQPTITVTNSYDNTLPNIDFDIALSDELKLRASYSETIARPSYDNLSASTTINSQYLKQAKRGNPLLTPLKSQNLDLSVEWYYGDASYVSGALFSKKVSDFIGTSAFQETVFDLHDPRVGDRFDAAIAAIDQLRADGELNRDGTLWNPDSEAHQHDMMLMLDGQDPTIESTSLLASATLDPVQVWDVSVPTNKRDDTITGLELSVQHWFGESGFGVQANYTMVDSDLKVDNTSELEQFAMLGVSDTANLALFYDKDGLQARIAYNWRDKYLTSLVQGGNNAPGYVAAYSQIDFSVSYDVSDNVTVSVEGLNITGEDSRLYGRSERQMFSLEDLGARYQVGVRYTF